MSPTVASTKVIFWYRFEAFSTALALTGAPVSTNDRLTIDSKARAEETSEQLERRLA